jgi:hypothetical protein
MNETRNAHTMNLISPDAALAAMDDIMSRDANAEDCVRDALLAIERDNETRWTDTRTSPDDGVQLGSYGNTSDPRDDEEGWSFDENARERGPEEWEWLYREDRARW